MDQLDEQLAVPTLKQSQLQIYGRLQRTSYDIENQHFDDAKAHLADARIWAAKTPNPLASAWVSAISGDLYRALQQPQLALGDISMPSNRPKASTTRSFSACCRTR